jgi:hypothetical protein
MKPGLLPIVLVVVAALFIVVISIVKNRKDKKELEKKLNDVFTKKRTDQDDVETENNQKV